MAGPVIHSTVPSAWVAASLSMAGASAASSSGTRPPWPGTDRPIFPLIVSPAASAGSPRSSGVSTARYSRMCRAGRPKLYPYMSSITIRCDRPMPSVSRPPRATDAVMACWAMTAGCRG